MTTESQHFLDLKFWYARLGDIIEFIRGDDDYIGVLNAGTANAKVEKYLNLMLDDIYEKDPDIQLEISPHKLEGKVLASFRKKPPFSHRLLLGHIAYLQAELEQAREQLLYAKSKANELHRDLESWRAEAYYGPGGSYDYQPAPYPEIEPTKQEMPPAPEQEASDD